VGAEGSAIERRTLKLSNEVEMQALPHEEEDEDSQTVNF
jgi:hypothetical protein